MMIYQNKYYFNNFEKCELKYYDLIEQIFQYSKDIYSLFKKCCTYEFKIIHFVAYDVKKLKVSQFGYI